MISGFSHAGDAPHISAPRARRAEQASAVAGYALIALLLMAVFGRIMSYPLQHDEQIHIAAGAMVADYSLYRELGYNHLPNLALFLSGLFKLTGGENYLLVGRFAVFGWWIVACGAIALIARRATGSRLLSIFAIIMLVSNTLFLGQPGLLVTNSFAPMSLALLGTYFFLSGLDAPAPRPSRIAAAGLCIALAIGFRVSYVFLVPPFVAAALFVPARLPFVSRARSVMLPFALAGVIGMLPTLVYFVSDPQSLFAHTVSYFTGPHQSYWQTLDVPKVMSLAGKVQLAEQIWFSGATLLAAVAAGITLALAGFAARGGDWSLPAMSWPIRMVLGLILFGALVSFVPTPAFAQYYAPPIIFLTVLALLGFGLLDDWRRRIAVVLLTVIAVLSLASGATRLGQGLAALASPVKWAGVQAHMTGVRIATLLERAPARAFPGKAESPCRTRKALDSVSGALPDRKTGSHFFGKCSRARAATLSPILALEAGLSVYPELAAGPFQYRVADLIPVADRRYYRIVSPGGLGAFLAQDPPVAIITGQEGELDAAFETFARSRSYPVLEVPGDDPVRLFVQPAPRP
ncbi:hypothetical protein [Sphingomonas cavernae]|uniref:Glycosyltransferase RgtA/B/C/D-like domain-containing protein n=1 Tax=Sphingomonas cavernae TaxID=2320861 RepID=A0A418WQX9_9SPHN|nr:hypothetical protein [Sphingomonas cavernae]RJF93653.1 hypothetical protein D3876_04950 [Sphingomonas cavernae]